MSYGNVGGGAEIGIKICEAEYQNQGYGKRCLRMLIESLFYDLKFKRIVLDTNAKNKRARHVYESLGFEKTGFHKDIWKDQNGVPQSSVDYELTRERFVKRESLRL
jgi:RimJ/RimL family protein N-acetyltransferase